MEYTSCPGKDRKLFVIVVVGALFVLEKMKSARRKRSNLQQPLSRLLKLKEMNPIKDA